MADTMSSRFGQEFVPNEILFREGDLGERMFVIQTGRVQISKSVGGKEKVLAVLGPGEFFGEMAILNGKPRNATATSLGKLRCLVIEARTFEEMVANNSEIALRLIKKLAGRLDSADTLVEILLESDPKARVLLALARRAEGYGEPDPAGVRVHCTIRELAAQVATDPRVAEQMMQRIQRLGIAYEDGEAVIVTEVERLIDFIDFLGVSATSIPGTASHGDSKLDALPSAASNAPNSGSRS